MRERRLGIGKRQAGLQRGNRHAFAQLQVTRMLQQSGKRIDDAACGRSCKAGGDRIAIDVPDRFQCMRQRVKSAGQGHVLRQAQHQLWVDDGCLRPGPVLMQGIFVARGRIPDGGPRRDFAAGARGGWDGDQRLAPIPDSGAASRKCESNSSKRPEGVLLSMALAQSITLPPPKATMQSTSAWSRHTRSYMAASQLTSGLGCTAFSMPASCVPSNSAMRVSIPSAAAWGKVISRARLPFNKDGNCARLPLPAWTATGL